MSPVISIENLSKKYLISHQRQEQYTTLRDVLSNGAKRFANRLRLPFVAPVWDPAHEEFWALRDVSFDIQQGERLGIIGRNGAGKSTLLKILSRITEPTSGRISIKGRVASLLEVGTGFHPELTGRENIFLNGAILGMTKADIKTRFDEIVAFSEVGKFLDTPVKRYSSGMYVRLAFAVAAHLEPEILIVDEILAVGDAQFQKRCLGKMQEVGAQGRTILFVSHNMAAITNMCNRGIYLDRGHVHVASSVADAVRAYLQDSGSSAFEQLSERKNRQGSGVARFSSVEILDSTRSRVEDVLCGDNVIIRIKLTSAHGHVQLNNPLLSIGIDNAAGQRVLYLSNETTGQLFPVLDVTNDCIEIEIPRIPLVSGSYTLTLFISSNGSIVDWIQNAAGFNVAAGDFFGTGKIPPGGQGIFLAQHDYKLVKNEG